MKKITHPNFKKKVIKYYKIKLEIVWFIFKIIIVYKYIQ